MLAVWIILGEEELRKPKIMSIDLGKFIYAHPRLSQVTEAAWRTRATHLSALSKIYQITKFFDFPLFSQPDLTWSLFSYITLIKKLISELTINQLSE